MSSFIADKIVMDGLTYDDVLLIPAYSEVLPRTVELTTKFSRHIELKVPFVTAAMDTVTAVSYTHLTLPTIRRYRCDSQEYVHRGTGSSGGYRETC